MDAENEQKWICSTREHSTSENQTIYSKNMKHFSNDGTEKTPYFFSFPKLTLFCLKTLLILLGITELEVYFTDR